MKGKANKRGYRLGNSVLARGNPRVLAAGALEHLPTWALRVLLGSRGYDGTPTVERINLRLFRSVL